MGHLLGKYQPHKLFQAEKKPPDLPTHSGKKQLNNPFKIRRALRMSYSVCGQHLVVGFPPFQNDYRPHTLLHLNYISRNNIVPCT